jgi:hypothetical protein
MTPEADADLSPAEFASLEQFAKDALRPLVPPRDHFARLLALGLIKQHETEYWITDLGRTRVRQGH